MITISYTHLQSFKFTLNKTYFYQNFGFKNRFIFGLGVKGFFALGKNLQIFFWL